MKSIRVDLPVFWISSGKHVFPDRLRESVMETLTHIPDAYDTVLFAFGFCGNAMVGVKSDRHRLVLPKAADCTPLFLGSQEDRNLRGTRTFFFTEGYLCSKSNIATEYGKLSEKYGAENAREAMREMMKHYESLSIIDTGTSDIATMADALQDFSELTGVPVEVIPGNLRLIRMLVEGDWPESDFLIKGIGEEITMADALSFQDVIFGR
jgi:hypothetical protein